MFFHDVVGEFLDLAGVDDAAAVHDVEGIAEFFDEVEVLFDEDDRHVAALAELS